MGWLKDLTERMAQAGRDEARRKAFEKAQAAALQGSSERLDDRSTAPYFMINGKPHVRMSWGSEKGSLESPGLCPECQAHPGQMHAIGCGKEECPNCGKPSMECHCEFR